MTTRVRWVANTLSRRVRLRKEWLRTCSMQLLLFQVQYSGKVRELGTELPNEFY